MLIVMTSPTLPLRTLSRKAPRGARGRPTPLWWRDLSGAACWAVVLFVVALWVHEGGITDLAGWGSGLTSLGRLTAQPDAAERIKQAMQRKLEPGTAVIVDAQVPKKP